MSITQTIALVLFFVLLLNDYISALTCFNCADCGDPFDKTSNETITLEGSNLYCTKVRGASIIDRNITSSCTPITSAVNGVWCCNTDLCNQSNQFYSNRFAGLILLVAVLGKFI